MATEPNITSYDSNRGKNIHNLTRQIYYKSFKIRLVAARFGRMFSVWMIPVFIYCIFVGKIFSKRNRGHWLTFLFFPTVFMMAAFFSLLLKGNASQLLTYSICLFSGFLIGLWITNPVPIRIDLIRQTISVPGSWLLFGCFMTLCVSKCAFDWCSVTMPAHILQIQNVSFGIKGLMTGLLFGQALSFCYRFWLTDRCPAKDLIHGRFAFFEGLKKMPRII